MKKIRVFTYIVPMGFFLAFIFTSNISIVYQGNEPKTFKLIVNVNLSKESVTSELFLSAKQTCKS